MKTVCFITENIFSPKKPVNGRQQMPHADANLSILCGNTESFQSKAA